MIFETHCNYLLQLAGGTPRMDELLGVWHSAYLTQITVTVYFTLPHLYKDMSGMSAHALSIQYGVSFDNQSFDASAMADLNIGANCFRLLPV